MERDILPHYLGKKELTHIVERLQNVRRWNDQTGTELPAGSAASWGKFRQWDGAAGELLP